VHVTAGLRDEPRRQVDGEIANLEARRCLRRRSSSATKLGAHARLKLTRAERLRDVVVGAGVERGDFFRLLVPGREDDDRHRCEGAQFFANLAAIPVGKPEIQDDQGRLFSRRAVEPLSARGSLDDARVTIVKRIPSQATNLRLVVDDRESSARRSAARP
jgi:hypothetical protein